jgi:signal transduction histidine kinase/DNA-binding response OmpR family regulator
VGLLVVAAAALEVLVLRPLGRITRAVQKYDAGDRAVRVPVGSSHGRGVGAPIGQAFNRMADHAAELERKLDHFLETRAEFIALVSHELRTPLTAIGGYAKLLLSGDAGPVSETQREFIQIVDTNVDRLTHLVSDILDVEKMESGKMRISRDPQDLGSVLTECYSTFLELARSKGLELRLAIDPGIQARVLGDRSRLVQIFMNLLSNAVKYTEKGSVELGLRARDFALTVYVNDTGPGMTSEEVQKLFTKFYRTKSGLSSIAVGTGLGLFLADRLVRAHGGSITVQSSPGSGTRFEVTLPALGQEGLVSPEVAARQGPPTWIWVIDPDAGSAVRLSEIIEGSIGHARNLRTRVFSEVSGIDAVAGEKPELIILDPMAGAYDTGTIPRLRATVGGAVPVLVVSGSIETAVAFSEEASAMLTKPLDEREVEIAIRELLAVRPKRVLVVDPSADVRGLLKRELEQNGLRVDEAPRTDLALGMLETATYDLALLDSAESVRAIRGKRELESLQILVMVQSAQDGPERQELVQAGASGVVDRRQGIGGMANQVLRHLQGGSE